MHEGDNGGGRVKSYTMKSQKILFITLSNIGDVILTLPVLSALKDNFPGAKIDVVTGPRPKEIFAKDAGVNRIFIYDKHAGLKEKFGLIKELRTEKYDLAIDMRSSIIPLLIGAKKRSGLISANKNALRHKKLMHLNKLKGLGIRYKDRRNICIDTKDREIVERLLGERGVKEGDILIGVSPSCRSVLKQWRTDGFIEVIKGLLSQGNYKVVLIGDPTQTGISGKIMDSVRSSDLIDLTGKTGLGQVFALIERMRALLTCDSAALHIACDLGVKVVAIFGPTDPEEYGPSGKCDVVIRKDLECAPCGKALCRFNHECMRQVSAEEVLRAALSILKKCKI